MKHMLVLSSTGVLMGLLSALIGLPGIVELSVWLICYVLWVVYAVRVRLENPVRRIIAASTLAGLFTSSIQVLLMESYRANNPWYAQHFEAPAQQLATHFLGQGIGCGFFFGMVVGLVVRWRIKRSP
jgi:hypothetical protein